MADTSNSLQPPVFSSMGRRVFKVGESDLRADMRRINAKLRGEHEWHRCTCATDHGWH